ncbi:MAG: FtsX-like permease family protein [Bacteroidota bacterium]
MKPKSPIPPKLAQRFLHWFLRDELAEEVEGDLGEQFYAKLAERSLLKAKLNYWYQVLSYLRPFAIRKSKQVHLNQYVMFQNYFKIGWRNLIKNKGYSFINIGGLAIGMAVAILIGLWVYDELSFDRYHENYNEIARVMQHRTIGDKRVTWYSTQVPLGEELRNTYGSDFERVVTSTFPRENIFTYGNEKFPKKGFYMEKEGPGLFSFKMLEGNKDLLNEPSSIFISASFAQTLFGDGDPLGKVLEIGGESQAKITGVYEDFPANSYFSETHFIGSWKLYLSTNKWVTELNNPWGFSGFQTFVQLAPAANLEKVETKIKDVILTNVSHDKAALANKPETFLHPMPKWHLYWRFENGVNTGGNIEAVWLFGIIGVFVLLLACINFMNLSTARSEKRAKEVGVRKAIGSARTQLINQFYSESLLVAFLAFFFSIAFVWLMLPWFNEIANKKIELLWYNPWFWGLSLVFTIITGLLAGSYPALYLSSFNAIRALKGSFQIGKSATIPRKVLVVLQFTVSVVLIVGTITVYQQIQHSQNRPLGYNQDNLVTVYTKSGDTSDAFDILREELKKQRVVEEMAKSSSPVTSVWGTNGNWDWPGKDPDLGVDFPRTSVTHEYGVTVGWKFKSGRDFSRNFSTDTTAFVINEAAAKFIGLENPVGETIKWDDESYQIIGVIEDMLVESPYMPIRPHFFNVNYNHGNVLTLKLNPYISAQEGLTKIREIIKKYIPEAVIEPVFVDDEFARKFNAERRIGSLSSVFAMLAILISSLGLFGLATYMAEQRRKEIGIRKILGASTSQLWQMLSKDFVVLVIISCLVAAPLAYYFLENWLQNFEYRTKISWWVFILAGLGALLITLFTVSFQAIKAALMNPVKSLKSE